MLARSITALMLLVISAGPAMACKTCYPAPRRFAELVDAAGKLVDIVRVMVGI